MPAWISYLLAFLLVWQIGACPCGCADHHGWLELIADHHDGTAPGKEACEAGRPVVYEVDEPHHHCDGTGQAKYLRGSPTRLPLTGEHASGPPAPETEGLAESRQTSLTVARDADDRCRPSPMRAALMVWRI